MKKNNSVNKYQYHCKARTTNPSDPITRNTMPTRCRFHFSIMMPVHVPWTDDSDSDSVTYLESNTAMENRAKSALYSSTEGQSNVMQGCGHMHPLYDHGLGFRSGSHCNGVGSEYGVCHLDNAGAIVQRDAISHAMAFTHSAEMLECMLGTRWAK